ncbi:MAG: hypothetical protein HUU37_08015 [Bdellovibrionales bacterium]|nr:hypothetical protein [Bdellovibrionales bacterium]
MKNPIMFTFLLLALAGCNAPTEIPEFRGKLVNHTKYSSDLFEVEASFTCSRRTFMGFRESCGSVERSARVAADGSYVLEKMDLSSGMGDEYIWELSVKLADGKGDFTGLRRYGIWRLVNGEISEHLPELASVTVFDLKNQEVFFRPASGKDSLEWARTVGRDSLVKLEFDFGQKAPSLYYDAETRGWKEESAERIPGRLLFIPGALAADARVRIKGTLTNSYLVRSSEPIASLEMEVPFTSELPAAARSFSFDDRGHVVPSRELSGKWDVSLNMHRGYRSGTERSGFGGSATLECLNGKLSGVMSLKSGPTSAVKFEGDVPVTGACQGESGVMEFNLPLSGSSEPEQMRVTFERVGGNRIWLLGRELDKLEQFDAAPFTFNLKVRAAATGLVEGDAMVRGAM